MVPASSSPCGPSDWHTKISASIFGFGQKPKKHRINGLRSIDLKCYVCLLLSESVLSQHRQTWHSFVPKLRPLKRNNTIPLRSIEKLMGPLPASPKGRGGMMNDEWWLRKNQRTSFFMFLPQRVSELRRSCYQLVDERENLLSDALTQDGNVGRRPLTHAEVFLLFFSLHHRFSLRYRFRHLRPSAWNP